MFEPRKEEFRARSVALTEKCKADASSWFSIALCTGIIIAALAIRKDEEFDILKAGLIAFAAWVFVYGVAKVIINQKWRQGQNQIRIEELSKGNRALKSAQQKAED